MMVKFGDNPEHDFRGKDFSRNPYIVHLQKSGCGLGCGPLWAQGCKSESDV